MVRAVLVLGVAAFLLYCLAYAVEGMSKAAVAM